VSDAGTHEPAPGVGAQDAAPVRVVIAEDEAIIRMDLREMLQEEGHDVVGEARDGIEAVELARRLRPDVVFMDIKMPRMNGLEAAAVIGEERLAPVVMVTAFSQAEQIEEASRAQAMAYVVKPFSRSDIIPAMHIAMSRYAEARLLEDEVSDLTERLETRKAVDRAKGILMAKGLSEPEAFQRLQRLAMDKRKTLRDIAEALILAEEALD
jgi:AmiR/NasT family two-component response regulator